MFNVTPKIKQYMVENHGVAADASEEVVSKAMASLLLEGKLDIAKVKELAKSDADEAQSKVKAIVADEFKSFKDSLLGDIKSLVGAKGGDGASATPVAVETVEKAYTGTAADVRVKSVMERYNDTRTAAVWSKSSKDHLQRLGGEYVGKHIEGLTYSLDMPTERSKAIFGVVFKKKALDALRAAGQYIPQHYQLKDYERDILAYCANECRWTGKADNYEYDNEKLSAMHVKAVLDDSTSGGLEAVPIEYDAMAILTPLLNGELFPYVNITNVTRRRIEATKYGNPTLVWNTPDGTAISLFNTDSFITAFDNNIYPLTGAMEMGEDFLADAPQAVADIVLDRYGARHSQELDNVIATGNGTTQPEGLFTASGTTAVTPTSAGNAPTVSDYEGLMFGVAKEYRAEAGRPPNSRAVFLGNETSYARARGIPVDSSNDARRIFGMNEQDYGLFGYRYAINHGITNASYGFFCLNRYRMYRRQGMEVKFVTPATDWQLARENKRGLVIRSRWGGALELGGAGAKITTGQT